MAIIIIQGSEPTRVFFAIFLVPRGYLSRVGLLVVSMPNLNNDPKGNLKSSSIVPTVS